MTQSVAILGRQPALGLAELESLFGAEKLQPLGNQAALVDIVPADIPFARLGGTIKLGRLITVLDTTEWRKIEQHLTETAAHHSAQLPQGKMNLGLSVYGLDVKPPRINATGLTLKKLIKATGRPVRVVPNNTTDLSSAQVLYNDLTGQRAWELLFIRHGNQTYMAQTVAVQDINAYAARDQARPKRDARVGMLPPKLAQIIINLAAGKLADSRWQIVGGKTPTTNYKLQTTILDPFCGTGVVLQEAMLMGYNAYGTDLEPRMIEFAKSNLAWLAANYQLQTTSYKLGTADATSFNWNLSKLTTHDSRLVIASETYLGRPFSAQPKPEVLTQVIRDVDTIHKKFLQNVVRQTKPGFRICLALPAWRIQSSAFSLQPSTFKHLPILDHLTDLGYTRAVFTHVRTEDLVYHREGQIVARELVVLQRT